MIIFFLLILIGCFGLTALVNAFRSLLPLQFRSYLHEVGPLFWYRKCHRFFIKKEEISSLFISALVTKFILLFLVIAIGVTLAESRLELIVLFIIIWLFADFIPRLLGSSFPKQAMKVMSPIASLFLLLASPLHLLLLNLPKKFLHALSLELTPHLASESLVEVLHEAEQKTSIDSHNRKLIEAVVSFKDRIVREVMIPRVRVFSLPHTMTIKECAAILLQEGYSRIPVYKGTIDSIIGLLMYKDVLGVFLKEDPKAILEPISTLIKPLLYTPETKKVSHLLQDFRNKQMHLAIVVDEYGGTEGLVTIEDILEEIVGDIADEYDRAEDSLFTEQPSGGWIVDAKMSILDIEEHFGISIPQEGDFDTIGGYIFHKTGMIPKKGFHVYHQDFELEVLSSTDREIGKIRIVPRQTPIEKEKES